MNDCRAVREKFSLKVECCDSCHEDDMMWYPLADIVFPDSDKVYWVCCTVLRALAKGKIEYDYR